MLGRALAFRPQDRWPTAEELAVRLEAEAFRLEQQAPLLAAQRTQITDATPVGTTMAARPYKPRRALTAVLLVLAFAAAAAGSWYYFGR